MLNENQSMIMLGARKFFHIGNYRVDDAEKRRLGPEGVEHGKYRDAGPEPSPRPGLPDNRKDGKENDDRPGIFGVQLEGVASPVVVERVAELGNPEREELGPVQRP